MSGQPVKADNSMAAVRSLYNEGLSSNDNLVVDTRSILSSQYEGMCGESPGYVAGENGDYYVMNPAVEARFAQSLRGFRSYLGNGSFNINNDYVDYLGYGNCPDGSPGYMRATLASNFGILGNVISTQTKKYPPDSNEGVSYSAAMVQAEKFKYFLENNGFTDMGKLNILKNILEMFYNPDLTLRASNLLRLISWDERDQPSFPPNFDLLVREAVIENTGWRDALQSILDEVGGDDIMTFRGSLAWADEVHDKLAPYDGQNPIFQTLLLLLDEGETEIVKRFLQILTGDLSSHADSLLYSAASQELTPSRVRIIDTALRIAETSNSNSMSDTELLKEIILLLKYSELPASVQSQVAIMLNNLLESRTRNGALSGPSGTLVIAGILRNLNLIFAELVKKDYSPDEWENHISVRPEAAMLMAGAFREFDDLDVRLLKEALKASPPGNWDGTRSAWRFIIPLLSPGIDSAIRVDFNPNETSWDEHVDIFMSRYDAMERQYLIEGQESFLPFANPVLPANKSEIDILEPDRIDTSVYTPRSKQAVSRNSDELVFETASENINAEVSPAPPSFMVDNKGCGYLVNYPGDSMMGVVMAPCVWTASTTLIMGSAPLIIRIL